MNKPNRLVSFLYGLVGRSYVYESADDVREVIADRATTVDARYRTHDQAAQKLTDSYAFQPGLLDLHDDLYDARRYLTQLEVRARDLGHEELTESLEIAADAIGDAVESVAEAAMNTTVSSQIPTSR